MNNNRINQRVNLIGVITEIGLPKQSRGTDCFCTLRIVDETSPTTGISINFFYETFEKLPQVASAGDIIQIFGAAIRSYVLGVDAGTNAVVDKKYSAFGLYEGKDGSSLVPYQVSSKFRVKKQDDIFIEGLRKWAVSRPPDPDIAVSGDCFLLKDIDEERIMEGHTLNLICKVLHVCEVKQGEWMLFVWDGTDATPLSINTKIEDEYENPIPLQLEPSPLSRDVLCKFPTVGTVLRVISNCHQKLRLQSLKAAVDKWVQFKNISFEVQSGLWCGILLPTSKFSYLSEEDDLALQRLRTYEERARGNWKRMPLSCVPSPSDITYTDHNDAPVVTLMDVLCHPEVIGKFKCVVRVVATMPGHPNEFRASCGTYRLRLTLEDPTARIHAYLYAEDGVKFFGGDPSIDALINKHKALLGIEETDNEKPRNPPWVELCLNSYNIDEKDVWASRRYRIFDTTFLVTVTV
ncbi:protection of telomeres protein 1b-like [Bidens hawaiensis]|uniref:protection of telomeres protein 1b-like n=1 Tax=Bidens hawaiensis TaxID=980011 RepID=UPI0040493BFF